MSIVQAKNICKTYGIETILDDVSFLINKGDRIGVVGINGAGKSTLIKILAGEIEADGGELAIESGLTIGYLKQRDHFPDGGTVREEMAASATAEQKKAFEERKGYSYESGITGILRSLAFTDDYLDKPVSTLSGGERTRLALAALLLQEPDLLLLDEPTNHLDIGTLKWLEHFLKGYSGSLVIISHDRYFLDVTVNRIFEIENRRLTAYKGNYTEFKDKKQLIYDELLKHWEQEQAEIARQEEIIRRFKEHNTEHLVKRAQSREKRLAHIERLEKPTNFKEKLNIKFTTQLNSGNDVLSAENLSMSFGSGDTARRLFSGVNIDIKKGDRICIVGPNGIGKTTLLKILLGELHPDSGWVRFGVNVQPAYYDQEQQNLNMENNVLNEIHSAYIKYDQVELRSLLGRLGFHGDDVFKQVKDLAGGEKAKLSLLKLMMSGANLLIMDEPTNHMDIKAKEVIEDALMDFPGTLILVSHDRYLLSRIPTAIYELGSDGILVFPGKYEYYEQKTAALSSGRAYLNQMGSANASDKLKNEAAQKAMSKEERIAARQKEKEEAAAKRKAEKALANAETKIAETEARIGQLEAELCKSEVFSVPSKAAEVSRELEACKQQLEKYYAQWMEMQ